jgi:hypothetical protein
MSTSVLHLQSLSLDRPGSPFLAIHFLKLRVISTVVGESLGMLPGCMNVRWISNLFHAMRCLVRCVVQIASMNLSGNCLIEGCVALVVVPMHWTLPLTVPGQSP